MTLAPIRKSGFSLIELAVVGLLVTLLATLTIPAIQNSLRKARRVEVQALLSDIQLRQERWRAERPAFGSTAELGILRLLEDHPSSRWYLVALRQNGPNSYLLSAQAKGSQSEDHQGDSSCAELVVTRESRLPASCW